MFSWNFFKVVYGPDNIVGFGGTALDMLIVRLQFHFHIIIYR